jgi:hypothetical protein
MVISITFDPDLLRRVDELADALGQSRSAFIARLVREGVESEGDAIRAFQHPVIGPALLKAFSDRDVLKGMADVMGEQLTDQQLLLFRQVMVNLVPGQEPARKTRRAAVSVLRKKLKRKNGGQAK